MIRAFPLAALLLLASPSTARAEEDWYGEQIIATDAGSLAIVFASAQFDFIGGAIAGGAGMAFGGPIVHAAHGNYRNLGISLALRVGLVAGGALWASGGGRSSNPVGRAFGAIAEPIGGAIVGYVIASVIDIAYVATEDDGDDAPAARMITFGGRF